MRLILPVALLCLMIGTADAGLGINLFGRSLHPGDYDHLDLNEENWGLGLQHDLRVGERSRTFLEGGGFVDSYDDLGWHVGVGYRHELVGPLSWGAGLYLMQLESINAGEPIIAPLPQLSARVGALDLSMTYVPPVKGTTGYEAMLFSATIHPFGRTPEGKGMTPRDPDVREGLEFQYGSNFSLRENRMSIVTYRRFKPGGSGFRVGGSVEFETINNDDYTSGSRGYDRTILNVGVFADRLTTLKNGRDFDLVCGVGVGINMNLDYNSRYWPDDHEDSCSDDSWGVDLRNALGVEYRLARSVTLSAETLMALSFTYDADDFRETSTRHRAWSLESKGVIIGVILYFD